MSFGNVPMYAYAFVVPNTTLLPPPICNVTTLPDTCAIQYMLFTSGLVRV